MNTRKTIMMPIFNLHVINVVLWYTYVFIVHRYTQQPKSVLTLSSLLADQITVIENELNVCLTSIFANVCSQIKQM